MQHIQVNHEGKYYNCKECDLKFEGMEKMRQHIMRNHAYDKSNR